MEAMRVRPLLAKMRAAACLSTATALSLAAQSPAAVSGMHPPAEITAPDPKTAQQAFKQGTVAEQAGDWNRAFAAYSEAWRLLPTEHSYLLRREHARFRLVQDHVERADRYALTGEHQQAKEELLAALALDPGYAIARERWQQLTAASTARQQPAQPPAGQIAPRAGTHSFNYRGDIRGAYEEVGRAFGITVSFDPDLGPQQIRFRAENVDFHTALRLLGELTGTWWRALDKHQIHVLPDTPQKRQEYAPVIERTLFLPNLITPDRGTETVRVVSEIFGITQAQQDNRTHSLTLRGSPEALAMAEAFLADLEQAQGELMLEIQILEISRSSLRRLGITPPTASRLITLSPEDIAEAQESLEGLVRVLQRLFGQSALSGLTPGQIADLIGTGQPSLLALIPPLVLFGGGRSVFLATLPQAAAEFSENFSIFRRSQRLLLRAQDGQPVSFFLGDRFPVTIGRLTPTVLDPRLAPLLGQAQLQAPYPAFQFEEIGLKVSATPRMHPSGEVTLQLEIEIRSLTGEELNGIPVISNRRLQQTVRLRQDESSLVSGILQDQERRGITGWPGFGHLPGAGQLASLRESEARQTELLLVITPRVLRLAPRTSRSLYAGRERGGAAAGSPAPPQ
jgi:general secretion pathway protein D